MFGRVKSFPVRLHFRGVPSGRRNVCGALILAVAAVVLFIYQLARHTEVPATQCGKVTEGGVLALECPRHTLISAVSFASFGTPQGHCGNFQRGSCHLKSSAEEVAAACVGKRACRLVARAREQRQDLPVPPHPVWLSADPCPNALGKSLAVSLECAVSPDYNTDPDFTERSAPGWPLAAEQAAMKHKQWQHRIDALRGFPRGRFAGRGVVIVVDQNGASFASILVAVKMLRGVGCTLPIQVWHRGSVELPDLQKKSLLPYKVDTRDFEDFVSAGDPEAESTATAPLGNLRSHALAMLHSDLEEVLLLRPGSFPLQDPTPLFDSPEFVSTGAVFWPGLWKVSVGNPIWRAVGADAETSGWGLDAGWVLLRKSPETWGGIYLSVIFTGSFYAQLLDGDDDVFRMAWLALGLKFHAVEQRPALVGTFKDQYGAKHTTAFCGHATLHHDAHGRPLWLRTTLRNKRLLDRGANFRYLKAPRADGGRVAPARVARVGMIQGPNGTVDCLDLECPPSERGLCNKVAVSPELERFEGIFFDAFSSVPAAMREAIQRPPWSIWLWVSMILLLAVVCGLWAAATSAFSDPGAQEHSLVRGFGLLLSLAVAKARRAGLNVVGWASNNPSMACLLGVLGVLWLAWSSVGGDDRERMYSELTGYHRPVPRMQRERPGRYVHECAPCAPGQHCMPRVVHVTYGSHVLKHHRMLEAALGSSYTFHYYNDSQASEYMRTHCPTYYDAYECMLPGAYRSDIFRYCVLLHDGGMYLDNDLVLLVRPDEIYNESCPGVYLLPEYSLNSGLDVRIWTGMIISSSQEPIWQCMLDEININVDNHFYGGNPVDVTGPGLLSMCFHRYPDRVKEFGYNRRDSTIWLSAENHHGVPQQIAYEVNFEDKGKLSRDGREHYSKLWDERRIYSKTCRRHAHD